mgnify:CR=1 FL=1
MNRRNRNLSVLTLLWAWALLVVGCAGSDAQDAVDANAEDSGVGALDGGASEDTNATDVGADEQDAGAAEDGGADAAGSADGAAADGGAADAGAADTTPELTWAERFDLVFPADHVVAIDLDFVAGGWLKLLTDWDTTQQKVYYEAAMHMDSTKIASVGARLKGLSSLPWSDGPIQPWRKYPLKVDFNRFGGPRLHGLDKISLSNTGQDLSFMRERLAARLYETMDVKAPRTTYAKVTIDKHPLGLYVMVQPIDKRFLKERYGTADSADDGNLYKCVHNGKGVCNLAYRGADKSEYLRTDSCQPSYEACGLVLKTHEDDPLWNDYSDLVHLLKVLNNTPDNQLEQLLTKVFDVDSFLRLLAVTFTMSSYDSYLGKSNNFYLYHRPTDGRFELLPWDFDGAYNGLYCNDIDNPTCGDVKNYPLVARILAVPAWNAKYRVYLQQLLTDHFTVAKHKEWVAEFDAQVGPFVAADPNYSKDVEHYKKLTTLDPLPGFTENIIAFVTERRTKLLAALATE